MIVDETVKKKAGFVGLIVATLDTEPVQQYKVGLRNIGKDESCDSFYITDFVCDYVEKLFPQGVMPDQILALISDAVSYMEVAAKMLKDNPLTPGILQIKCTVHAIHRVVLELCLLCPELHQFLSLLQKVNVVVLFVNHSFIM